MAEAYIVDAVRTPVGRRGGGLSQVHPADLGAHSIKALIERTGIDPAAVDDVVFGNVDTIGPQAGDIARTCWLVAGFPEHVPGTTVDRQCGSAQQAVHFAAQGVMSGTQDLVVAGGVQNMSQIPIMSAMLAGAAVRARDAVLELARLAGALRRPGGLAVPRRRDDRREVGHLARRHGGVRGRVARAGAAGARRGSVRERDRPARRAAPSTKARASPTGRRSARCPRWSRAAASPPRCRARSATRSAALLIASEQAVKDHGLTPRARIHHLSVRGDDPIMHADRADPRHRVRAAQKTGHDASTTSTWSRSTRRSRRSCSPGRRRPASTSPRST